MGGLALAGNGTPLAGWDLVGELAHARLERRLVFLDGLVSEWQRCEGGIIDGPDAISFRERLKRGLTQLSREVRHKGVGHLVLLTGAILGDAAWKSNSKYAHHNHHILNTA